MSNKLKVFVVVLLLSPILFIMMEFLAGVINWHLLLLLGILYVITILLLVLFVIKKSKNSSKLG
jgi:hypothetical protein